MRNEKGKMKEIFCIKIRYIIFCHSKIQLLTISSMWQGGLLVFFFFFFEGIKILINHKDETCSVNIIDWM
jgi:hypothetical protein